MSRKIGNFWEKKACEYLISQGYEILDKNYYTKYGEIDIVAQINDVLVFVEVKFRETTEYGHAYEYVRDSKVRKIMKSAYIYIDDKKPHQKDYRLDVIAFDGHLENNMSHFQNITL